MPSVPFDRWLFTVDGAVGQSRSLAIAPISRGRFVGYSPSEKASYPEVLRVTEL
jgi:hypothetical protein